MTESLYVSFDVQQRGFARGSKTGSEVMFLLHRFQDFEDSCHRSLRYGVWPIACISSSNDQKEVSIEPGVPSTERHLGARSKRQSWTFLVERSQTYLRGHLYSKMVTSSTSSRVFSDKVALTADSVSQVMPFLNLSTVHDNPA